MTTPLDDVLAGYGLVGTRDPTSVLPPPQGEPGSQPMFDPGLVEMAKRFTAQARSGLNTAAKRGGVTGAGAAVVRDWLPAVPPKASPDLLLKLMGQHESGNDYTALNKQGSSASGKYQYTDGTWNGYGGYARAALAPRDVQERRAREDVEARLRQYSGDPFKTIVAHYLPAVANDPEAWFRPYKLKSGNVVSPAINYVRDTVANTPLQGPFDEYIQQYTGQGT